METTTEIITIRNLFNTAHAIKEDCTKLEKVCDNNDNKLIQAYHAAAKMVSSKYIINPFISIKVFNAGKNELENLILTNPDDTEMRFLRYTIQMNTPKFIGYYKNKTEDRKKVIEYLSQNQNSELSLHMLIYLTNTNDLNEEEKSIIIS